MNNTATSLVEIRFECLHLRKADLLSKSDPFIVLYKVQNYPSLKHIEIGRTEVIENTSNPKFHTGFKVEYYFEEVQQYHIEVYDSDSDSKDLKCHDFLGQVDFSMSRLMGSNGQFMRLELLARKNRKSKCGLVEIKAEEVADSANVVQFHFTGTKLDNKDGFFGKSDPFLNIYRAREDNTWTKVWTSEVIKNNLNPVWKQAKISSQELCNGDTSRPLRIECMDWERSGKHQLIGMVDTSLKSLSEGDIRQLELINAQRKKKKGSRYKNSGVLNIKLLRVIKVPTFVEFLRGGMEISVSIGIDYTASNGAPSTPASLHYAHGADSNQYHKAIAATSGILIEYDHDHLVPVFGFGGNIHGQVSHCFPLSSNANAAVQGVDGIIQAYLSSFNYVSLSGPTLFAPLIQTFMNNVQQELSSAGTLHYFVLLILTDGVIMDMQQTIDLIVSACSLPISIIIVGVGNADFSAMRDLDADDSPLKSSNGLQATRDIVQFVPFNQCSLNPAKLAKETLAELPRQVVDYMSMKSITPGAAIQRGNTLKQFGANSYSTSTGFVSNSPSSPPFPSQPSAVAAASHPGSVSTIPPPMYPSIPARPGAYPSQTNSTDSNLMNAETMIDLRISCKHLVNLDIISKSDPFAVMYSKETGTWTEIGRTEKIRDNLNPQFVTAIRTKFRFEVMQMLKIELYDADNKKDKLKHHDFLGKVEFPLGQVLGSLGQKAEFVLKLNGRMSGNIFVSAEHTAMNNEVLKIQMEAKKLVNLDGIFGKSDPFVYVYRSSENGDWLPVWRSETIQNNLNPVWGLHELTVQNLCHGDYMRPLKLQVRDEDSGGRSELIGEFVTNVQQLIHGVGQHFALNNEERRKKKGKRYKSCGTLSIKYLDKFVRPTFYEYLQGGCEMNLIVGIDYTASNGHPSNPTSLHHASPHAMNQYQQAIFATGRILEQYDSDKKFPVYGFGGQFGNVVDHCFPVSLNHDFPEVHGTNGILQAYANSIPHVVLSGPTLFAPLIQKASSIASEYHTQQNQKYFVLLIITDGAIMDMQATIDILVHASTLPLSVVIIGVGNADFSSMKVLDGDKKCLRASNGVQSQRDIVQFVPFSKIGCQSESHMADHVLKEIPGQLLQYMKLRGYHPNPPQNPTLDSKLHPQMSHQGIRNPVSSSHILPSQV